MNDLAQLLGLAYASELGGLNSYKRLDKEPFVLIASVRQKCVMLLEECCKVKGVDLSTISPVPIEIEESEDDILIGLIAYENGLCRLYERMCDSLDDDEVKDIFFRLWATSYNEFIPALKIALADNIMSTSNTLDDNNSGCDETQNGIGSILDYQKQFESISKKLENMAHNGASKDEIMSLFNDPKFSFFSGMSIGALAGSMLINKSQNCEEENKKD